MYISPVRKSTKAYETRREKFEPLYLRTVPPEKTASGLNIGYRQWRDCTVYVAKTKALISFAVTASLFLHMRKAGFLTTRLISISDRNPVSVGTEASN